MHGQIGPSEEKVIYLHELAVQHHTDDICITDSTQPMRNDQGCAT